MLRLVFISCHPVLSREARVALTLRLLGGLTTDEIARAFLVAEPTVAQRIVRAKRTLTAAQVPFEVPTGAGLHRPARLGARGDLPGLQRGLLGDRGRGLGPPGAVPGGAAAGPHPRRADAGGVGGARPGRADGDPGLAAAAPGSAPAGEPVLLPDQDRGRWDRVLISRGLAALDRAERAGGAARARTRCRPRSPPATPAPARVEDTDWARIAALYEALAELTPSPVVELNRAVAVSRAYGPAAGLELVDALDRRPGAARLPPAAERPRRPARAARPARRGARRVRARGRR